MRELIGPAVHLEAGHLLGGHVVGRPEELSRARETPGREARDAEVEDLGLPVLHEHDVGRLDVPVDDAVLVRVVERQRQLADHLRDLGQR